MEDICILVLRKVTLSNVFELSSTTMSTKCVGCEQNAHSLNSVEGCLRCVSSVLYVLCQTVLAATRGSLVLFPLV